MWSTIGCSAPANIANGEVKYKTLTRGSIAEYECDDGYVMNGSKRTKCTGTSWNRDPPKCDPSEFKTKAMTVMVVNVMQ